MCDTIKPSQDSVATELVPHASAFDRRVVEGADFFDFVCTRRFDAQHGGKRYDFIGTEVPRRFGENAFGFITERRVLEAIEKRWIESNISRITKSRNGL